MKHKLIYCLLLGILFGYSPLTAQSYSVELTLNYDTVAINEVFTVRYTVKNTEWHNAANAHPQFEALQVVAGPMSMNSVQIINGHQTSSTSKEYHLQASQPGIYSIPGLQVETPQGRLYIEDQAVVVVESLDRPRRRENNLSQGFQFSFPGPRGEDQSRHDFFNFDDTQFPMMPNFDFPMWPNMPNIDSLWQQRQRPMTPPKRTQKKEKTYRI